MVAHNSTKVCTLATVSFFSVCIAYSQCSACLAGTLHPGIHFFAYPYLTTNSDA